MEIHELLVNGVSSYLHVDFKSLVTNGVITKYQKSAVGDDSKEVNVFAEKTDFYPEKHLNNVLILVGDKVFSDSKDVAIVFNGKMNKAKMLKYFLDEKLKNYKEEKVGKSVYYTAKDGYTFTFLNNDTIMFGGIKLLKNITENASKKVINKNLVNDFIANKSNNIRGTFLFSDEQKKLIKKTYPKFPAIEGIKSLDILVEMAKGIGISVVINTLKKEDAVELTSLLNNLKLLGIVYGAKLGVSGIISKAEVLRGDFNTSLNINLSDNDIVELKKIYNSMKLRQKNGSNTK